MLFGGLGLGGPSTPSTGQWFLWFVVGGVYWLVGWLLCWGLRSDAGGGPWELFQDFSICHLMDSWILPSTFHMMRHVLAPAWPTFPLVWPSVLQQHHGCQRQFVEPLYSAENCNMIEWHLKFGSCFNDLARLSQRLHMVSVVMAWGDRVHNLVWIVQFLGLAVWSLHVLAAHWFWLQAMIYQFMHGDGHMNYQTRLFTHSLPIMSIWPISHFTFSHIAYRYQISIEITIA